MSYRVRYTAEVRADLLRLNEFLLERDAPAARRALVSIRKAAELLASFPYTCRKVEPDNVYLRELVVSFGDARYVALLRLRTSVLLVFSPSGINVKMTIAKPAATIAAREGMCDRCSHALHDRTRALNSLRRSSPVASFNIPTLFTIADAHSWTLLRRYELCNGLIDSISAQYCYAICSGSREG